MSPLYVDGSSQTTSSFSTIPRPPVWPALWCVEGAHVIWRCHVGTDRSNAHTREAWDFLLPHLAECHAYVFSRAAFVPSELASDEVWIIEPSIDPLSAKNRPLPHDRVTEQLVRIGLMPGERPGSRDMVLGGAGPFSPGDRVVVQVSRWDHLKDMLGVLHGFAEHVAGRSDARLALVGPSVDGVADDPEGAGCWPSVWRLGWRCPSERVVMCVSSLSPWTTSWPMPSW